VNVADCVELPEGKEISSLPGFARSSEEMAKFNT
jgi:hypothetical protein